MSGDKFEKAVILLGADIEADAELMALCAQGLVIAADSGIRHAAALGLTPHLWVGDFDSVSPELEAANRTIPRKTYSPDKDKTDGELAIDIAVERGIDHLVLVGSLGGQRADHALLNTLLAVEHAKAGRRVVMTTGRETAVPVLSGTHLFDLAPGTRFSLIGFSALQAVSIEGAKWPLSQRDIPAGSSMTLSNVALGRVCVTIGTGCALFMTGSGG